MFIDFGHPTLESLQFPPVFNEKLPQSSKIGFIMKSRLGGQPLPIVH